MQANYLPPADGAYNNPEQFAAWLEKATRQQILAMKDRLILQTIFYKNCLSESEAALARKTRQVESMQAKINKKTTANQRLDGLYI